MQIYIIELLLGWKCSYHLSLSADERNLLRIKWAGVSSRPKNLEIEIPVLVLTLAQKELRAEAYLFSRLYLWYLTFPLLAGSCPNASSQTLVEIVSISFQRLSYPDLFKTVILEIRYIIF